MLIGVSQYVHLAELPAVANNLPALADIFRGANGWSLEPQHCSVVAEPADLNAMLTPVAQAAREAEDTLLIYFAGHGLLDDRGDLFLGLTGSYAGQAHTGVPYSMLRSAITTGQAQRHVIILDCCFSGRALGVMSGSMADHAQIDGSYLLAAAPETKPALAPPGERFTAFTGELLQTLENGVDGAGPWLDLESVYRQLLRALTAKGRPVPQKRGRNTAGDLLLGRNRAYQDGAAMGHGAGEGGFHWPDPVDVESAEEFIGALGRVRAASGRTVQTVSRLAPTPVAAGTISTLLNRTTVPRTWRSIQAFLGGCGMPADQIPRWHETWLRLRELPAQPAEGEPSEAPPQQKAVQARRRLRWMSMNRKP
ncbi:caspase family protein [Kitasatospora sp. RB6PN24]|uniref:caspase family protein n=1 Tax=Kitasatospora humi TaxID=2893891 RepID=UPI001E4B7901|nr:caspase family protein [Kitasatospora humi]MCC9311825.1 caspase family protein [Kitasatospora humi]